MAFSRYTNQRLRRSFLAVSCTAVLCVAGGVATTSSAGAAPRRSGGSLVFGSEISLTGEYATFGAGVEQGLKVAKEQVNAAGGVLGKKIQIDVADDSSDPVDSVPKAHQLVSTDHVLVQVGEAGPDAEAIYRIFTKTHIPFFTSGGDTTFNKNTTPYVWRLTPSDQQLGPAMGLWAHAQHRKTAALVFSTGIQQTVRKAVEKAYKGVGGKVVDTAAIAPTQSTYSSTVQGIIRSKPSVILTETSPATFAVIERELTSLGKTTIPVIGSDTMIGTTMTQAIPAAKLHRFMTNCEAGLFASPASKYFTKVTKKLTGKAPEANAEYGYDGTIIAALAMDEAHSTSGPAINRAVRKVTDPGGTKVYTYAEGLRALKAGKRITYVGASGPFYYNKYHNVFGPFICVRPTVSGTYQTLKTFSAAQLKAAK